jgi:hypothetical protein
MSTNSKKVSPQIEAIKEYFRRGDTGEFPAELFAQNFQFYFPKYGVDHGAKAFFEMAGGVRCGIVNRAAHHIDDLFFIEQGNSVAVEGTTEGTDVDGVQWYGGSTRGGRFCSIFVFGQDGLIDRMHVYLDPDYTGRHKDGFVWPGRSSNNQW